MRSNRKRILVISYIIQEQTGGGIINRRNIDLLKTIFEDVAVLYIDPDDPKAHVSVWMKLRDRLRGVFGGLSSAYLEEIRQIIAEQRPDIVFVNQSLLGAVAKLAKMTNPTSRVVTFFHNCEMQYYRYMYTTKRRSGVAYLNLIASRKAERMAIRYSDRLIAMNGRDAKQIGQLYGKPVDLLLPTSFVDNGGVPYTPSPVGAPLELHFVGFNFFANVHGVLWFCREVMPRVDNARLTIVGRGMEQERAQFEGENIRVIGSVDDLRSYYAAADMIVSPIFIGSGMKTKTAEALMYGRPLLATAEALEGYDVNPDSIGAQCDTADQFIKHINYFSRHKDLLTEMSNTARRIFVSQYSQEILESQFCKFIEQL